MIDKTVYLELRDNMLKKNSIENQNVLMFMRTMNLGGTENVALQICEILKPVVNKIVVCSCGGINVEKLDELAIKHYRIPDIGTKSPKAILATIIQLKKIVKEEQITVIHSHHRMAAFYTELLFGKKIIKIANAHNTFTDKRELTRFAYRNTHVIAVGGHVKENLIEFYGLMATKVTVIHNSIKPFDDEVIPINELTEAKKAGFTLVGNIGRLSEQKGLTYYIQASKKVLNACKAGICPKVKFYIIGSGELEEELKAEAQELLPGNSLTFLGYHSDIQNVMAQLDVVVLSSLWEGFPLTPIEAFSVGKPVIATAVDGTPEIVKDRENGILVEPRNVAELAEAMIELIKNKDERNEIGKRNHYRYAESFSYEKLGNEYIAFYNNIK